jgi:hypothetical protein
VLVDVLLLIDRLTTDLTLLQNAYLRRRRISKKMVSRRMLALVWVFIFWGAHRWNEGGGFENPHPGVA